MNDIIASMTYEQFNSYCNQRACDGLWDIRKAVTCLDITNDINSIKVTFLGFTLKNKTKQAREKAWRKFVHDYINN